VETPVRSSSGRLKAPPGQRQGDVR